MNSLEQPVAPTGVPLHPVVGPIGDRKAYELDVAEAQARYDANPSSMNHEDLYAAKWALRRHWPNARISDPRQ